MISRLHIITPVKDSIDTTRQVIDRVMASRLDLAFDYTIYNDYSSEETTAVLEQLSKEKSFQLVNLNEITKHPSPNYLLVLQMAQQRALEQQAALLIVESDVLVQADTFQRMLQQAQADQAGMVAAVTTDEQGQINFPYLYAKKMKGAVVDTRKRFSFCCTLLTPSFLASFDFHQLNPEKNWYDVFISHQSIRLGFRNYLLLNAPVVHLPHSSRPWKQLKYTHPIKYYWLKLVKGLDKI